MVSRGEANECFVQKRDVNEGADIIMVKPAMPYLDIIQDAKELAQDHPLACYQVSGEYAMIVAGARAGVYELKTMAFETVESFVRAGRFTTTVRSEESLILLLCRVHPHSDILHSRLPRVARTVNTK